MKNILCLSLFMLVSVNTSFAMNMSPCRVFVFYEGSPTPEPTDVTCDAKSKTMKACMKSCLKAAKKSCGSYTASFKGNVNFNSPTSGFEVNNIEGNCKTP